MWNSSAARQNLSPKASAFDRQNGRKKQSVYDLFADTNRYIEIYMRNPSLQAASIHALRA